MESEITKSEIKFEPGTRVTGKVFFINKKKGYAFVNSTALPFTRIFMHWQELPHTVNILNLKPGTIVDFEPVYFEEDGWRALKVKMV